MERLLRLGGVVRDAVEVLVLRQSGVSGVGLAAVRALVPLPRLLAPLPASHAGAGDADGAGDAPGRGEVLRSGRRGRPGGRGRRRESAVVGTRVGNVQFLRGAVRERRDRPDRGRVEVTRRGAGLPLMERGQLLHPRLDGVHRRRVLVQFLRGIRVRVRYVMRGVVRGRTVRYRVGRLHGGVEVQGLEDAAVLGLSLRDGKGGRVRSLRGVAQPLGQRQFLRHVLRARHREILRFRTQVLRLGVVHRI